MKKLMLGLMMAFAVTAEAVVIDGIDYEFDGRAGTATITGYDRGNPPTKVDVAEVEWGRQKYAVTSVGSGAFYDCKELTSVCLPNATAIGATAFSNCENLKEVSLPNDTTIGRLAFSMCEKLTSVYLPNATTIKQDAFQGCGLTSVSLPNATTIERGAFNQCGSLTSVSLPNATTIGEQAFYQCGSLTSVCLPNATAIGATAFSMCEKLTSVYLPNATTIGEMAFAGCEVLSSLVVNAVKATEIKEQGDLYYGFFETPTITVFEPLSEDVVKKAGYEYKTQVSVSSVVKSGDTVIDENDYLASCTILDIQPQKKLNETDFKAVSKDAQVIGSDEIAVKKESIQAAKAETISIANNEIQLGVSVMSNSNITAEIADWGKVNLLSENVKVENGNVVITIPVDSASGFMILQSKDAKVNNVPDKIIEDR